MNTLKLYINMYIARLEYLLADNGLLTVWAN